MTGDHEAELTLADARRLTGACVRYVNTGELGDIVGTSDRFVFVRYGGGTTPKATAPELLRVVDVVPTDALTLDDDRGGGGL